MKSQAEYLPFEAVLRSLRGDAAVDLYIAGERQRHEIAEREHERRAMAMFRLAVATSPALFNAYGL